MAYPFVDATALATVHPQAHNSWVDVKAHYSATGDGTTDDLAAINSAIGALPSTGGTLFFPPGIYKVTSTITTGTKSIHIVGCGDATIIKGTGFAIVTVGADDVHIRDLQILESAATNNVNTKGITFDGAHNNWAFQGLRIRGRNGEPVVDTNGTGIDIPSALKGVLIDCNVESWGKGVRQYSSQAVTYVANKIRVNTVGIENAAGGIAGAMQLFGNTIEGNFTGIKNSEATASINLWGNHLENVYQGTPKRNVELTGGFLTSEGNLYAGAASGEDIVVVSGTNRMVSIGDEFNSGITHSGTGIFRIVTPTLGPTVSGTGPIRTDDHEVDTTYSSSIAVPSGTGTFFRIVVTNATDFTIQNPTNGATGQRIRFIILNTSGGAMGTITWGSQYRLAGAFTNPANNKRRTIEFVCDSSYVVWVETSRAAADVG